VSSRTAPTINWTVAVVFAAISVAGEAMHSVPGSGHAINTGGGLLCSGLPNAADEPIAVGQAFTARRPRTELERVHNSGWCPICRHSSQPSCLAAAVDGPSVLPFIGTIAVDGVFTRTLRFHRDFQARAPPSA